MPTTNLTIIIFSNNVNNKYNLRPLVILVILVVSHSVFFYIL